MWAAKVVRAAYDDGIVELAAQIALRVGCRRDVAVLCQRFGLRLRAEFLVRADGAEHRGAERRSPSR